MPKELFVGNLNREISREEIEDVFDKYGKVLRCDLKNRGKPRTELAVNNSLDYSDRLMLAFYHQGMGAAFCFVEFEEERDAEVSDNARWIHSSSFPLPRLFRLLLSSPRPQASSQRSLFPFTFAAAFKIV